MFTIPNRLRVGSLVYQWGAGHSSWSVRARYRQIHGRHRCRLVGSSRLPDHGGRYRWRVSRSASGPSPRCDSGHGAGRRPVGTGRLGTDPRLGRNDFDHLGLALGGGDGALCRCFSDATRTSPSRSRLDDRPRIPAGAGYQPEYGFRFRGHAIRSPDAGPGCRHGGRQLVAGRGRGLYSSHRWDPCPSS